ncbi:REP-associated tyrosine transposase [Pseudomonas syringae group sp. J309-1]|uniref:REP-associated tyrosine transposase n=1 Tax=Pseudomonas syringae group sp. J309-1 TaxID=3079588 RepID=UPI002907206D|nr:transposase [Pseudomonas syringae group sp. J309-1]MDU8358644.1 transposase [Pseudomonas syringae group sp. J309-1]
MSDFHRSERARTGRYSEPGRIYLLTSVAKGRQPVFADWRLGRCVVKEFRSAQEQGLIHSLAWVVMPDHFHWLVELQSGTLQALMQGTKSRSAIAVNRMRGCSEQLWQRGFHHRALRYDEDLLKAARYIIANPLRARLVKRVGDYPLWDAVWL